MKRNQLEEYIKQAIEETLSASQDDISQLEGTCGYKYDAVTGRKRKNTPGGLEETVNETVNFEGEEYDIISKDGDWVYLRSIHDTQIGRKEIKVKEKDIKYLDEVSSLKSYIKEALKQYIKGSPWSHGIAIGHRINKYNDPELIRKRYDKAAATGFQRRPKGRLSNPRGYALNEGFSKEDWDDFIINAANQPANDPKLFVKDAYDKGFNKDDIINALQQKGGHSLDDAETYYYNIVGQYEPVNEFKDCNCGCDDYEETFLREYIQKYISPKIN